MKSQEDDLKHYLSIVSHTQHFMTKDEAGFRIRQLSEEINDHNYRY